MLIKLLNGKCFRKINRVIDVLFFIMVVSLLKFLLNIILMVVLLKMVIYNSVNVVGISKIFSINFCRVWLKEICVINKLIKGV